MPTFLVLSTYAIPYAVRVRRLRRMGRAVARWRMACFACGLAALGLAASPGVGGRDETSLGAHMAEHLLIGDIAPLLLVAGCSGPILAPLLRNRAAHLTRWLGHPLLALVLWAVALYAWHLPRPYDAAVQHSGVHLLEHGTFFLVGLNLWQAFLGPLTKPRWFSTPARIGLLAVWWIAGSGLGALLVFSAGTLYGAYRDVDAQSAAGAIMMVEQATVAVTLFCWLFLRGWQEAGERQELAELAAAAGIAIDDERLARAAASTSSSLRRRLEERA